MTDKLRTYRLVDLAAVRSNVQSAKSLLPSKTKLALVVKANAYSHGAVEIAKACEDLADYFGVATVEEGAELRASGLLKPILVLGAIVPSGYDYLVRYDLQPTVHSLESALSLSRYCVENGVVAKVHFAVDTGMGRIGFLPDEQDLALKASSLKGLKLEGIFTHFACADGSDKSFTCMQAKRFDEFVAYLKGSGVNIPLVHASNSAGILDGGYEYDMARCGIIAYGLYPSAQVERKISLKPALSWYTLITHIKTLRKGASVSYGATFTAERDTVVATLPVGYADGYPRILSSRASVLVKGKRAKIIGRICMDQMMIDVTDIEGVGLYDEVTLIGAQGSERVSAEELANLAGTINYEIVCNVSRRVPLIWTTGSST